MSASAKQAFRARIVTIPSVSARVGRRIYPEKAPQNTPRPYVVLSGPTSGHERHMGGTAGISPCHIQCDVIAETDTEATAIASDIRMACDGYRGAVTVDSVPVYFRHTALTSQSDAFIEPQAASDVGVYHIHQDWSVIITEPVTTF